MARGVESLEPRTLFAVATNDATFTPLGPTAVTNGAVAGAGQISGRVTGIATDPTNANVIYAATADGGVWKTVDDGTTWADTTDTQPTLVDGAIAIAPSRPGRPSTSAPASPNLSRPTRSPARASSRRPTAASPGTLVGTQFAGQTFAHIAVDPTDPNTLYAAVNNGGRQRRTSTRPTPWRTTDDRDRDDQPRPAARPASTSRPTAA